MARFPLLCCALLFWPSWGESSVVVRNRRIAPRQTLSSALGQAGVDTKASQQILQALSSGFDFRKVRAGDQFRVHFREGRLEGFDYRQSLVDEWLVREKQGQWVAEKRLFPLEKQTSLVVLSIRTSLYDAILEANEGLEVAMGLAEVFAWDIDFYRDPQKGDAATVLLEKFLWKGNTVRYGDILAARYEGATVGLKQVFRYQLPSGDTGYFLPDGASARKTFLKSPLKFANITSRFGRRLHPVLQYHKAHNGVDYGTPIGTPVWAVADGTVTRAHFTPSGGNTLCIRHANSLETCYLHLSRFGPGIRQGVRVVQKQVIAFSGNTGRSTGPHLHFELHRGGRPVNPLQQAFPRAEPVPPQHLADFQAKTRPLASQLESEAGTAAAMP